MEHTGTESKGNWVSSPPVRQFRDALEVEVE